MGRFKVAICDLKHPLAPPRKPDRGMLLNHRRGFKLSDSVNAGFKMTGQKSQTSDIPNLERVTWLALKNK